MKERPILFNGEMVRAILDGRKTQTRRMVKPQPRVVHSIHSDASITTNRIFRKGDQRIHSPFGTIGDRLWVRETWSWSKVAAHHEEVLWRADRDYSEEERGGWCWRPSIHMPRWASRITLEITAVRVERVQEIAEEDAIKEGMGPHPADCKINSMICSLHQPPIGQFAGLWQSLHSNWDANPWVWVYSIKLIKP